MMVVECGELYVFGGFRVNRIALCTCGKRLEKNKADLFAETRLV